MTLNFAFIRNQLLKWLFRGIEPMGIIADMIAEFFQLSADHFQIGPSHIVQGNLGQITVYRNVPDVFQSSEDFQNPFFVAVG